MALGILILVLAAMAERGSEEALALLDQVEVSSTDQEAKEHAEGPRLMPSPKSRIVIIYWQIVSGIGV